MKKNISLSRMVDIADIQAHKTLTFDLRATPDERVELAKRCNILEVRDLNATLSISIWKRTDLFKIEGIMQADVVQACCVTLTPVQESIEDNFSELLTTSTQNMKKTTEEDEADAEEPIELIQNDQIDIGEIVAQWLVLSMNPFPRSDAPEFKYLEIKEEAKGKHTPFAVLADVKDV